MTLSHGHKGQQQQILSSSIQEFILTRNKTPKCANHIDPHEQHMSQSQPKSTQQTLDVKCPQTLNKHQYKIQEAAKKKFFGHNSYITPKKQKKQKKRKKKNKKKQHPTIATWRNSLDVVETTTSCAVTSNSAL